MRGARRSSKSVEAYVLADVVFEKLPLKIPNVPISPLPFLLFAQPLSRIATRTNRELEALSEAVPIWLNIDCYLNLQGVMFK
ncbi:hypothetical protein ACFX13_016728 [Malus domestica]